MASLLGTNCGPVYTPPVEAAFYDTPTCHQVAQTSVEGSDDAGELGFAVGMARFGISLFLGPQQFEDQQAVLAGAPLADGRGVATVSRVDGSGALSGSPVALSNFGTPVGASGDRVGHAILGVDVLTPYDDHAGRPSHALLAAGDEVLVGAPAFLPSFGGPPSGDGPGAVHLFYVAYDGVVGDNALQSDRYVWRYQGSFTPTTAAPDAEFGASLARADAGYGNTSSFVVIGAPGEDAVYVIQPDDSWTPGAGPGMPASAVPFGPGAVVTKIDGVALGATAGDRFGASVLVEDLDDDGDLEIIVGAPRSSTITGTAGPLTSNGGVWVLPGTGTASGPTPWVDLTTAVFVDSDRGNPADNDPFEFANTGFSLAAGRFREANQRRVLVAGAPGTTGGQGGSCQYWWPQGLGVAPVKECRQTPFFEGGPSGFGPFPNGFNFGIAMAAGNYSRHDTYGNPTSVEATAEEVVISHLGSPADVFIDSGTTAEGGTYQYYKYHQGSPTRGGTVSVFRSDSVEGARITLAATGSIEDVFAYQIRQPSVEQADAGFGRAIFATTLGLNRAYPRLIIGSPWWDGAGKVDNGRVFVTTPEAALGFTDPLAGSYTVVDSVSDTRGARLVGTPEGYKLIISSFTLRLLDSGGALCASGDFDGEETVPIVSEALALSSGGTVTTDIELVDAAGNEVVTLPTTIAHNASTNRVTVTMTEPRVGGVDPWPTRNCLPVTPGATGNFVLENFEEAACD
jgi:hypothetical protein